MRRRRRRKTCHDRSMRLLSQWEEKAVDWARREQGWGGCLSNSREQLCPLPACSQAGKFLMMSLNVFVSLTPSSYVIWVTLPVYPSSLWPSGKGRRESSFISPAETNK